MVVPFLGLRAVPRLACRSVNRDGLPFDTPLAPLARVGGRGDRCRIVRGAVCLLARAFVCVDSVLPAVVRLYRSVMLYI